jgi:hypothetical protein
VQKPSNKVEPTSIEPSGGKKKLKKTKSDISDVPLTEVGSVETQKEPESAEAPKEPETKSMSELEKRRADMEKRKQEQLKLEGNYKKLTYNNDLTF